MKKLMIALSFLIVCTFTPICALGIDTGTLPSKYDSTDLYKENEASIQVFNTNGKLVYVNDKDIELMAKIVYGESRSEPFEGKVAVASVILNRLKHPKFPHTVEAVVKQKNAFSCVKNGNIDVIPDESCYQAVNEALKGNDPTSEAVFFYNPKIATSQWMKDVSKMNIKAIGNHVFFKAK